MDFFAELILRLFSKTPHFFKVIKIISVILAAITGLPSALMSIGLDLPDVWDNVILKAVSAASVGAFFVAQLTVTTKVKQSENLPD
jgi:hypothetical protein